MNVTDVLMIIGALSVMCLGMVGLVGVLMNRASTEVNNAAHDRTAMAADQVHVARKMAEAATLDAERSRLEAELSAKMAEVRLDEALNSIRAAITQKEDEFRAKSDADNAAARLLEAEDRARTSEITLAEIKRGPVNMDEFAAQEEAPAFASTTIDAIDSMNAALGINAEKEG